MFSSNVELLILIIVPNINTWECGSTNIVITGKQLNRALGVIFSKFNYLGGLSHTVYTQLFDSYVQPVLNYSSIVWGVNMYKEISYIQNKASRFFLGVIKNASNAAVRGEMGWRSQDTKIKIEVSEESIKSSLLLTHLCMLLSISGHIRENPLGIIECMNL